MKRSIWSIRVALVGVVTAVLLFASPAAAHDFRPALLQLREVESELGVFELRLISPSSSSHGPIAEGELRPLVPEHCTLTWHSPITARLDCGEQGLVGPLGLAGLDTHPVDVAKCAIGIGYRGRLSGMISNEILPDERV